eukprot:1842880-Alexandrium_andersonii.AAC.1
MGESKLLQFCGPSPRSTFVAIHGYAKALLSKRATNIDEASDSAFMTNVKSRVAYWMQSEG